jgi:hypothetical protein
VGLSVLCGHVPGLRNARIEDFSYRMLAFFCGTCCGAFGLLCYIDVSETRHQERVASAFSGATLALITCLTHLLIGYQALPIVTNYTQRQMHVARAVGMVSTEASCVCMHASNHTAHRSSACVVCMARDRYVKRLLSSS